MVDAVVSFVVQRLGDYLIQEAVFLRGVRNEVQLLKNELEWMQCFIKDAEERQVEDAMIRKWVSDIRDTAYDIEDVLDTFMLKVNDGETSNVLEMGEGHTSKRSPGFFASIKKCSCIFDKESTHKKTSLCGKGKRMVHLYDIGKEIEALRQRISDLSCKRESYRLENYGNNGEGKSNALGKLKELRRATSFVVEENFVGFEDDANMLLAKLLDDEPQRFVISIFGMGGLGKTTLAKKLYHNNDVKRKFTCRAWVSVSQDYKTKDLLRRIINSFQIKINRKELEKMSKEDLERCLNGFLLGHSYLIVIDDVWEKEAWESLKSAFPNGKNGSRVIITTRIKEVAERSDERTQAHELRFLRQDESWDLFYEKAFRNSNPDKGLENLGREMVQKCGGLPLAIVVLGGFLSSKKPQEWRRIRDHIWRHLRNDSSHISYLLALSFDDLSYQLKLCFLYLSIYPEDSEILMEELTRLLVAEGFLSRDHEDQVLEDVARSNMDELINRSLIQIESRIRGRVKTCRVHDVLRDLATQKAKELNFIHIGDEIDNSSLSSVISSCRRVALHHKASFFSSEFRSPGLRSLLLFSEGHLLWSLYSQKFRLLRVIHIARYGGILADPYNELPKVIGQLIHLKYLAVRNSCIDFIPESIFHLRSLQTLDVYSSNSYPRLSPRICKLQELRHLIGKFMGSLPIDSLGNLQTLKFVSSESWRKINPAKLVNLRELHINLRGMEEPEEFTFDSISKLKSIQILWVKVFHNSCFASL